MKPEEIVMARRYMELKTIVLNAEDEMKELQSKVTQAVFNSMGRKGRVVGALGSLSLSMRKKWTYSPAVKKLEEALKEEKTVEEANGTATFDEVPSIMFRRGKDDGDEGAPAPLEV